MLSVLLELIDQFNSVLGLLKGVNKVFPNEACLVIVLHTYTHRISLLFEECVYVGFGGLAWIEYSYLIEQVKSTSII